MALCMSSGRCRAPSSVRSSAAKQARACRQSHRSWGPCRAEQDRAQYEVHMLPDALAQLLHCGASAAATLLLSCGVLVGGAHARMEGVNKPELLPRDYTPVIDVAGFLTDGEEKRLRKEVEHLEEDTGIKLRVLAQNYPNTPGLAIKDYWGVDEDTVVFVADPNTGNILNFNVGSNVDLRNFWSRLAGKFGTKFYWQDRGEEAAIVNAVRPGYV